MPSNNNNNNNNNNINNNNNTKNKSNNNKKNNNNSKQVGFSDGNVGTDSEMTDDEDHSGIEYPATTTTTTTVANTNVNLGIINDDKADVNTNTNIDDKVQVMTIKNNKSSKLKAASAERVQGMKKGGNYDAGDSNFGNHLSVANMPGVGDHSNSHSLSFDLSFGLPRSKSMNDMNKLEFDASTLDGLELDTFDFEFERQSSRKQFKEILYQ